MQLKEGGSTSSTDWQPVTIDILSYFVRNPQAADGLESIARWRLLGEVIHRRVDETRAALEWLVERGYLIKTVSSGASPIYRLNPDKLAEAVKALAESEHSGVNT